MSLSCVQHARDGSRRVHVFSGFLIEAAGVWFYLTAGHVLRDLKSALDLDSKFDTWRLDDQSAGNTFDAAIPFDFDIGRWLVIENELNGLDYAAVVLDPFFCRQLKAGGAVPIDKIAWGDYTAEHDFWAVVGIPAETVHYQQENFIHGKLVIMPLEPTEPPEGAGATVSNRFFAHIKDPGAVNHLGGMSGGPVFALFKNEGRWRYKIIGLQSGWYRSEAVISACPISSFAEELESVVQEALAMLALDDEEGTATRTDSSRGA